MFPVNLKLDGRLFLLVGAGRVGRRKLTKLLKAGARGRVVEPDPDESLRGLDGVEILPRFEPGLLEGVSLVFAASSDRALNRLIAGEARRRGLWVNVADDPDLSDFDLPAVVDRGGFLLTVSTGGASPALAAKAAERLRQIFGPEYAPLTRLLGGLRPLVLASPLSDSARQNLFKRLLESDELLKAVAQGDQAALARLLAGRLAVLGLSDDQLAALAAEVKQGTPTGS